ncbi:MAG TPA: sulfotransferase [Croceibacterium sp.]
MSHTPRAPSAADRDLTAALVLVERLRPALEREDRAQTVDIVRRLAALRAPMGEQWLQLSQIAADNGELGLARAAVALYAESAGNSALAQYHTAGLFAHIGAWREAKAAMGALPANVPDRASHAHSSGTAALFLGEAEEARSRLEEATVLRPRSGATWVSLAALVDFAREPELAERLIAGERTLAGAAPLERAAFCYALGKAHADRAEHPLAFAAFSRGAAEMKSLFAYSRERDGGMASEATDGYTAERIAAIAGRQTEPTARSIFVTGLPRSGTTLVEQILTSHSAVSDGAEINRLSLLVKDIRGLSWHALGRYVERAGAPEAARLWHHWLDERFPGSGRVVDKTTNTTRMLGIAAALLPEAPLIWLRRDPLDCAWSCFRTFFRDGLPWSHDLADIAFHFRLEDRLLEQWQQILGERLLVVPYEDLVSEPEPWIRRILAHCDLPEEPQVFAPHLNRRAVTTSSMMQVRRPINREGIGAAEPYREFLQPFLAAYRGLSSV